MPEQFFASCPRGLEALLADDLATFGAHRIGVQGGGVAFEGDWPVCMRANLHSRLATRILHRVAEGAYQKEDDLYRLARSIDWPAMFGVERSIRVGITAIRSPLKSLDFVTLRIKDAVCDRFREQANRRPDVDTRVPDMRIQAFLTADRATIYLDTSGEPLYQRGLRQKTVDAPLKENLAAGILRLAGWQPGVALLDPMCGSGTFLLEAAQIALDIAPGAGRAFAFEKLVGVDLGDWKTMRQEANELARAVRPAALFGADVDPRAFRAALANLDRAGLLPAVELLQADIREVESPVDTGIMVCNPPYGVRLAEQEQLAALYPDIGAALKRRFAGWDCWFLSADTALPKGLGLKPFRKTPLFNGNLECRLYGFRMVAGSNRREKAESL
jgi:putative N6-adenine-specific DNA methylase